jgi:hypothetical protein
MELEEKLASVSKEPRTMINALRIVALVLVVVFGILGL